MKLSVLSEWYKTSRDCFTITHIPDMANKQTVLLTNDDGPESPLLRHFVAALNASPWLNMLRVVIPAEEQSWIAKSITRFKPLLVTAERIEQQFVSLVTGTPADCVSLGINNLFPDRPTVVLSGINMGTNAGVPFMLSSGTIGGAIESALNEIPALAFSVDAPGEIFQSWNKRTVRPELEQDYQRLAQVSSIIAGKLIQRSFWRHAPYFSINLPWEATANTRCVITRLTHAHFTGLFTRVGENTYQHKFEALKMSDCPELHELPGDLEILKQGLISVTPLKLDVTATATKDLIS